MTKLTKTFEVARVGVILSVIPVISTNVVDVVDAVGAVTTVWTTCNTFPEDIFDILSPAPYRKVLALRVSAITEEATIEGNNGIPNEIRVEEIIPIIKEDD